MWAETQWRHQPWVRGEACRTTAKISAYDQRPARGHPYRCLPQVLAVLTLRDLLLGRAFGGDSRAPTVVTR